MTHWLNLARAAQLIGIRRATLQRLVQNGELSAFEGQVAVEELQQRYPDLHVEGTGDLERVTGIKTQAFARRVRERVLPSQESLALRVAEQAEELAQVRGRLSRYHDLVESYRERLKQLLGQPDDSSVTRADLAALADALDHGLASILATDAPANPVQVLNAVLRVMSAHVTVRPSGHEFFVHGDDTLLDAALKAGLSPAYGCGSGGCGLCKARVISGTVRQTRPADCALSATEKAQGYTLLCSTTAVSDLVIELLEADSPADLPEQHLVATLKSVTPLADEVLQIHLQTPRSQRLRFFAGQSVTLAASTPAGDIRADYPVASCPCDDRNLRFHIPHDNDDAFAQRLFAGALLAGAAITVSGPWGDFALPATWSGPVVFLACDLGYAPVASLIEHALAADHVDRLHLVWHTTRPGGHYQSRQCRAWAEALDHFTPCLASATDPATAAHAAVAALAADARLSSTARVFVAGPADYVATAVAALSAADIATGRVHALVC